MISTSLLMSAIFAVAVIILPECFLDRLLLVFQTPLAIYADARNYLAIFLIGYVAIFLYMQLTSIYRSFGDSLLYPELYTCHQLHGYGHSGESV